MDRREGSRKRAQTFVQIGEKPSSEIKPPLDPIKPVKKASKGRKRRKAKKKR